MEHINRNEFYDVYNVHEMKERNRKMYNRIYNHVIKEWKSPEDWFEDENKTIHIESRTSDRYWIAWSIIKCVSLPSNFINKIMLKDSKSILKNKLIDYQVINGSIEEMKKTFAEKYVELIYSMVLKLCNFKGTNNFKDITIADVSDAYNSGLLQGDGNRSRISLLLYYSDYTDKYYNDSTLYENLSIQKAKINKYWDHLLRIHIKQFINDLKNANIGSYKMEVEKIRGLNIFSEWYCNYFKLEFIDNLSELNRELWLAYIDFIRKYKDVGNNTKSNYLRALKDFYEWSVIKSKDIFNNNLIIESEDYKNLNGKFNDENKAFEKREHGEKILKHLIYDYTSNNIRDLFRKEAIIIAANSGARIEEIRMLEYGSAIYSEDERSYKTIISYPDKINNEGVPLYLTKDGYEAFKRVEKLKIDNDVLKNSYDKRAKKSYIHLFEYRGRSALSKTSLYNFIEKIKIELNLLDEDGNLIKGGMHSLRHMFGKTMFIESNYNIEVVRYLLRHKDYKMTFVYIQEEKEFLLSIVQGEASYIYSGGAIDTIVDLILNNDNSEYEVIQKVLNNSKKLSDIIEKKLIKKIGFGYCLNPCAKKGCVGCKNFLLTSKESEEILNATLEIFEIICLKKFAFKEEERDFVNTNLDKDIKDLIILLQEIKNLGLDYSRLPEDLRELINHV